MAFRYSASVREAACRRMLAGEPVEEVAGDLEMSAATLYRWKRQALIDVGRKPGVKAASALFNGEEVVRPKGSARSSKG